MLKTPRRRWWQPCQQLSSSRFMCCPTCSFLTEATFQGLGGNKSRFVGLSHWANTIDSHFNPSLATNPTPVRAAAAVSCQDGRWCDHNSSCVRGRPWPGVKCGPRVSTLCVHSNAHQLRHSPTQGQQSKLTLWKNRRLQIFHILLIADVIDRQHLRVRRVCY